MAPAIAAPAAAAQLPELAVAAVAFSLAFTAGAAQPTSQQAGM